MAPSTRHTLSAVLSKIKVGGLVLVAMLLITGTAEAAVGFGVLDGGDDTVGATDEATDDPTDGPTDVPTDTPTDDPTDVPTDTPTDDPTDVPTDTPTDDPTDDPTDEACENAKNHGEYVSSIAKSTPGGPGKGQIVSEAARSDCGKKHADDDSDEGGPGEDGDDSSTSDESSSSPGNSGNAPGQVKKTDPAAAPGNSGNAPGHNKSGHDKPSKSKGKGPHK